jgi:hypothetical protein
MSFCAKDCGNEHSAGIALLSRIFMKHWFEHEKKTKLFGEVMLALSGISALIVLLTYAYIGTFTRYWADDFCFTQYLKASNNLLGATLNLYNTWSDRYTTMLLAGVSEWFGPKAISYLPAAMIGLWFAGLTNLIQQIKLTLRLPRHLLSSLVSAGFLAFLTIFQAPDRYQSVFWRSGMVTYFAPLVFYTFGAAFIINQVNRPGKRWPSIQALMLIAGLFFLSGGLSETTLALQTGALLLALATIQLYAHGETRPRSLALLLAGLLASFVSLAVVFSAPGNTTRLTSMPEPPALIDLAIYTLRFSWDFIWLSIKTLPTPTVLTIWIAGLLSLDFFGRINPGKTRYKTTCLLSLIIIIPLTAYALILCATAPSVYVYGKFGYPPARALFPSRFIMTAALFLMGLVFGLIIHQLLLLKARPQNTVVNLLVMALLGATIFYPLKTAQRELTTVPIYQKFAIEWDNRDTKIQAFKANQVENIRLDGIESPAQLIELNPNPNHWVNRCVANFYDLETIAVFPN